MFYLIYNLLLSTSSPVPPSETPQQHILPVSICLCVRLLCGRCSGLSPPGHPSLSSHGCLHEAGRAPVTRPPLWLRSWEPLRHTASHTCVCKPLSCPHNESVSALTKPQDGSQATSPLTQRPSGSAATLSLEAENISLKHDMM